MSQSINHLLFSAFRSAEARSAERDVDLPAVSRPLVSRRATKQFLASFCLSALFSGGAAVGLSMAGVDEMFLSSADAEFARSELMSPAPAYAALAAAAEKLDAEEAALSGNAASASVK